MPPRTRIQAQRSLGANVEPSTQSGGIGPGGMGGGSFKPDDKPQDFNQGIGGTNVGLGGDQGDDNKGNNNNNNNNNQDSQVTETKVETKEKEKEKSFDVFGTIKDFYNKYKDFGGVMGLGLLPFKMIAEPTVETFQNPRALATLKLLFDEKGQKFKDEYLKDHGDILSEAYADDPTKDVRGLSDSDFFDEQLQEGAFASEQGILGAGSQRINFPEEFYTGEKGLNPYGPGGMPQTTNDLVNLASLAVTPEMQGNNPKLAKMIFDARMELDRMGKDSSGNPQGGGSTGIPSLYGGPITPSDPNAILKKPGLKNPFGLPDDYSSGFMQSEFYKPNQPGLAVMTPVKMPDGTTHMFGNSASANQFQQYLDYLAMNKMGPSTGTPQAVGTSTGVPAAFNYASIAPQFTGSQYTNQGVSPAFLENLRRFYG